MGSAGAYEDHQRKEAKEGSSRRWQLQIVVVILTNLLTIFIFFTLPNSLNLNYPALLSCPHDSTSSLLLAQLNSTTTQLAASRSLIADLHERLDSTNLLVQALLIELADRQPPNHGTDDNSTTKLVGDELISAIGPHKLPLGRSPTTGLEEIYPSVGAACLRFREELAQYMKYDVGGECPPDDVFAQRLMLKGCEPLPRRRCHPKSPPNYKEPAPFPESLWTTPPDSSIVWDPYTCKSYQCLVYRRKAPGFYDCKDCFDLQGREKRRWLVDDGGLSYSIDQVLKTKPGGTIRVGLDIGGGSGTFAARMRERNVTIVTSSMNLDGPFNSFIASRGLIPIHITVSQRLPFFENTLDIVHSMHVLSNWIPDAMLELALYDIYRVLRPGGIFWLDHFFCAGPQLNATYIPMFDQIGFNKLKWNTGLKLDRGFDKNEWYISALLEKPIT